MTSEEEDGAVAVAVVAAAGAMRAAIAVVIGTSETGEMTRHPSGATVAGNAIEIGGIVNETAFAADAPHQDLEDPHPAEISGTATCR